MLNWEKDINGYTGHWYGDYNGFDDGALCYSVGKDYEDGGWFFVSYLEFEDGECSLATYLTAEAAMAAAEEEYAENQKLEDEDFFDPEEAFMVLADLLYEQRRDERMGW